MTPVFAIGDARAALRLLRGKSILMSFFYIGTEWIRVNETTDEMTALLDACSSADLDSGAFSKWNQEREAEERRTLGQPVKKRAKGEKDVTRETFAAFVAEHGTRFAHVFNFDVIGDADASVKNWHWLCAQVPALADRIVPVWHEGDPIEHLREYNPARRLVGLGRTEGRRNPKKSLAFYDDAFNEYPDGAYHALGNGSEAQLSLYPFRRFDATSWQRDAVYAESHGFPWNRVSKETRMRAYIEAFEAIRYRGRDETPQQTLFSEKPFDNARRGAA